MEWDALIRQLDRNGSTIADSGGPAINYIDPETLRAWIAAGAVVVDVREAHEYQ